MKSLHLLRWKVWGDTSKIYNPTDDGKGDTQMGFAMRMNFVDVVVSDSLKNYHVDNKKMGYQFDIRLSYYRGHFLSVIDEFKVKVDDFEVPTERIKFCINGKE